MASQRSGQQFCRRFRNWLRNRGSPPRRPRRSCDHPPPPPPAPFAKGSAFSSTEGQASEVAPPVEEEPKNVITIKPPIIAKELATQLGMKNFQLIKELMDDFNIFVNANQTIEPDVATKIAERHGFVLEKERREKGGGVHKEE